MIEDRCQHCQTPYIGDLDENGKPFCDCEGSIIAALQAEIDRLREAQRWIPVSEEPDPSTCTDVYETENAWTGRYWVRFVLDDSVFFGPGEYDFNRGCWFTIYEGEEIGLHVTHYTLLPEPPQGAEG